jgi:hypothetical protein
VPKSASGAASKAAPLQVAGRTSVHFDFRVPTGPAGSYSLAAEGAGFHCDCFPFTILRDVEAANQNRPGSNNGGSLARTGFTVLGLLVLAAVLLVFGRAMVEASRRRSSSNAAH